jgi:hypothetical protein
MATEADVMQGGPGTPVPAHGSPAPPDGRTARAAAPAAASRKVVLDGVEYEVDPSLANALQKERDRIAGSYGARLQSYERRIASLEAADEPEPEDTRQAGLQPPDSKWLDATSDSYDPERYHRESIAYNQALVQAGVEAVESRRYEEQQIAASRAEQQGNWNRHVASFYEEHPVLKGQEDLVDAVWRGNFAALKDLSLTEGFSKLAELSKTRLIQLSEAGKRVNAPRHPRLETSQGARANRAPEPTEEPANEAVQGGLSAAIKAKRNRFLNPNFGSKAA